MNPDVADKGLDRMMTTQLLPYNRWIYSIDVCNSGLTMIYLVIYLSFVCMNPTNLTNARYLILLLILFSV